MKYSLLIVLPNIIDPDESLQNLTVRNINATSVSIQWRRPECIKENSVISNYIIKYYLDPDPEYSVTRSVSVRDMNQFIATDLIPKSTYTFEISLISESGRGPKEMISQTTKLVQGWV